MKKSLIIFLFSIMLVPLAVKAETRYLYDVLKDESESGGLAREYTGEHHDSFIKEPTHKIYHWYDESAFYNSVANNKSNVIFQGICWQIIRTTDTGGVKMIYNGKAVDNKCLNNRENVNMPKTARSSSSFNYLALNYNYLYGKNFEYDSITKKFKLIGEKKNKTWSSSTFKDIIGNYTCASSNDVCDKIYYVNNYKNDTEAYVTAYTIDSGAYSSIAYSFFSTYNHAPSELGYMYNDVYLFTSDNAPVPFGNSVVYDGEKYTLVNYSNGLDSTRHYTCLTQSISCKKVKYYFYSTYYIELENGKMAEDALDEMLWNNNVNKYDSNLKSLIDNWFEKNLLGGLEYIEDTVYCNDRDVIKEGSLSINNSGWNKNGNINGYLYFEELNTPADLACPLITDQFSNSNELARLKYPVGMLRVAEYKLLKEANAIVPAEDYWLISPAVVDGGSPYTFVGYKWGNFNSYGHGVAQGVRPVISLKKDVRYQAGDGSQTNPYLVKILAKSNVTVINDVNKGIVNIDKTEDIEETSQVVFEVNPKTGYKVSDVIIKDNEGNDIEYINENNQYTFEMPGSDVTITTVYEKLKYKIDVVIVNETKDFSINITDLTQVEYEEEVNFKVTPIRGFQIKSVSIVDKDNNEVEFTVNDNEYNFIMPASDVTIKPVYERVKNAIIVEDNSNTEEVNIEVNDVKAVVYEDKVVFSVVPEKGYVLATVLIKDKDGNEIDFIETGNKNEFELIMPDVDIIISLSYEKIPEEETDKSEKNETENISEEENNPNTGNSIISLCFVISLFSILAMCYYIPILKKK